ncbi:MAG: type II toxin-antitoxin system RelE/ParE family toxin [Elusimicrobia bacterium]|nr:type II toxin-antitoxin system RelE/ParE family toxin [Elusimicrobiota bacterium]
MNFNEPQTRRVVHLVSGGRDIFGEWFDNLKDTAARAAIRKRLGRAEEGNFGDHRSAGGNGVCEMRIDFGPGYRLYYGEDGPDIVLLLCGGDKSTQRGDIRKAQRLWAEHRRFK